MQVNEITGVKKCSRCKQSFDISNFHKAKDRLDGHANICKACAKAHGRAMYLKSIDKVKEQHRKYRESHREESKAYRDLHREEIKESQRLWRIANSALIKERAKKFREVHAEEIRARSRLSYYRNRDRAKDTQLKKVYGISLVELEEMWESQDGKCSICEGSLAKRSGGYAIDHNHSSGKVRGLICSRCNFALGLVLESETTLLRLIEYLKRGG